MVAASIRVPTGVAQPSRTLFRVSPPRARPCARVRHAPRRQWRTHCAADAIGVMLAAAMADLTLEIVEGPGAGRQLVLERPSIIGRSPDADLPLEDGQASRRHAQVSPASDGSAVVEDLGSANGTFVNHNELVGPARLDPGDEVLIGVTPDPGPQQRAGGLAAVGASSGAGRPGDLAAPARLRQSRGRRGRDRRRRERPGEHPGARSVPRRAGAAPRAARAAGVRDAHRARAVHLLRDAVSDGRGFRAGRRPVPAAHAWRTTRQRWDPRRG